MIAAVEMTITQRRAAIGLKLAQLQRRMPDGWEGWSHAELVQFRADLRTASRHNGSMFDLLLVAYRIADAYGVHQSQVDPCYGEAA